MRWLLLHLECAWFSLSHPHDLFCWRKKKILISVVPGKETQPEQIHKYIRGHKLCSARMSRFYISALSGSAKKTLISWAFIQLYGWLILKVNKEAI